MKSGMTPLFTGNDIESWFEHFQDRSEEKIFTLLQAAGEKFVEYSRKSGKYMDHTGNLRSSVGYVIIADGQELTTNFEKSAKGTDRTTGEKEGHRLAESVAESYPDGFVLIGVTGMDYAVYVEAMEGKDVISGACIRTEEWLRKALRSTFDRF